MQRIQYCLLLVQPNIWQQRMDRSSVAKFLDALIKVLLDPLHTKVNVFLMQRITIEGFLIQYDPLHPMQYKDPLHPSIGSSASTGCGIRRASGTHEITLSNRVFGLPILKWATGANTTMVAASQAASRGGKQPLG